MTQDLLDRLCGSVDAATMWPHMEAFAQRVKLSGTPEELESFRYLQHTLDGYGFVTRLIQHQAYISLPGKARIELDGMAPRCITHSMSLSSAPGGTRADIVYVGAGRADDYANRDVRGKIVLLDGMATPPATRQASLAGAIGQIHISPHEHIHEMCVSPVWGSPTEETRDQLPTTVVVSIDHASGQALKARVASGRMQAVLHAAVDTGWRDIPLLVAELMPAGAPDAPFVMFSGHHDTWYFGVMDNGGANATMLEVARLLVAERSQWRRGLRLCFWSGHSHGRYAGSTWYADNHWLELERRCVAHVNVDSTGAMGNTVLADAPASAELVGLGGDAVSTRGGQELDGQRMARAGDQSFWGIGLPSLFMGMGEQPASNAASNPRAGMGGGNRKGAGFGWWWHTPDDTLDKMDPELLVRDTQIYVHAIGRLLTDPVLPFDYAAHATYLRNVLRPLQDALGSRLDITDVLDGVEALEAAAGAARGNAADPAKHDALNAALMKTSRAMVPMDYTAGDRFAHGPALPHTPYPVLDPVRRLATAADPREATQLTIGARRACNRLAHALQEAVDALSGVA